MSVKIAGCHCQKMCYILVAVKFVAEFSSFTAKDATSLPSLAQKCAHLFVFLIEQMVILFGVSFWLVLACASCAYHARTLQGFRTFCFHNLHTRRLFHHNSRTKKLGDKRKNVGDFLEKVQRFLENLPRFLENLPRFLEKVQCF